jgi:hypothetical protein
MSTFLTSYCNATTDLQAVLATINDYDQKRLIAGWVEGVTNTYSVGSVGEVTVLYKNEQELGAAESAIEDVVSEGKWFYDDDLDLLTYYSTVTPGETDSMKAGQDWKTVKEEAVGRASEFVRAYLGNKQIIPRIGVGRQSETLRDYEDNIIQATAYIACSKLAESDSPELAERLMKKADDPETGFGLLNRIKSGEIALWNETTELYQSGKLVNLTYDNSSTGAIEDLRGSSTIAFDLIKVIIATGGTFIKGQASTVTYNVFVGDSTGLKNSQVISAVVIDGNWQTAAHGIEIKFSFGTYAANDEWEIEVRGDGIEAGTTLKSIKNRRI